MFSCPSCGGNTEKLGPHSAQVCCVMWEGPDKPSDRGSRVSWHPVSYRVLMPRASSVLTCISQFSVRLGDESATGSWSEDKPKSPEECSIQDHAFFLETKALYKASLTVLECLFPWDGFSSCCSPGSLQLSPPGNQAYPSSSSSSSLLVHIY